jgi:transglutaminase-like putative cysteine protease
MAIIKNNILSILLILLMLQLYGCSSELILEDIHSTFQQLQLNNIPSQQDYPDADAVVVLDLTDNQTTWENRDLITYEKHHIIKKIFRNTNEQSTVNLFVRPDEELFGIKARTLRPNGEIINLQSSDFYTISGMGESSILYSDIKTIRFTFPAVEKECMIEYVYQKKKNEPFVRDVWYIQNSIPTLRNQYSLTLPKIMAAIIPYQYKSYPDSQQIKPIIDTNQIRRAGLTDPITFTWARSNVPAFKPEEMMPPPEMFRAQLRFARTAWAGWSGIGNWYNEIYFQPRQIITDSVRLFAKQLTDSCRSTREKIKSIYESVQKIRYVAIQLGLSGLQPSLPQTILNRRYGDCKDKAILCIALLKSIDIQAYPVLVLTADDGILDPSFPSWHFNHMIVKVQVDPNTIYWMDPTSEFSPFGTLPWEDQGINVLTLYENGGQIEITPGKNYNENGLKTQIQIYLSEINNTFIKVHMESRGEEARHFRAMFSEKGQTEVNDICKEMILNQMVKAEIDTITMLNLSELDSTFSMDIDFHVPSALKQQGDILYFNPSILKEVNDLRWTAKETRKYPIWFPTGYTIRKHTTINLADSSLTFVSIPKTVSFQNNDFSYGNTIQIENQKKVTSEEVFLFKNATLQPSKYKEVKEFFQNIKLSMERSIFLKQIKK